MYRYHAIVCGTIEIQNALFGSRLTEFPVETKYDLSLISLLSYSDSYYSLCI